MTAPFLFAIASLCAGVAGALLRVVLAGILGAQSTDSRSWTAEILVAVVLGAGVGFPLAVPGDSGWVAAGVGAGMTTYAAASGAMAFISARARHVNPVVSSITHLIAASAAAALGFFTVFTVFAVMRVS